MSDTDLQRVVIWLDEPTLEAVRRAAGEDGRPVSQWIRRALMELMKAAGDVVDDPSTIEQLREAVEQVAGIVPADGPQPVLVDDPGALAAKIREIEARAMEAPGAADRPLPKWRPDPKPGTAAKAKPWQKPKAPSGTPCFTCSCKGGVQGPGCRLGMCPCHGSL